jgi:hypothetical protein
MSKTTLSLIEDLVTYRDRISDRADRDMLADVANELSRLNARMVELDYAYRVIARGFETDVFDFSVLRHRAQVTSAGLHSSAKAEALPTPAEETGA